MSAIQDLKVLLQSRPKLENQRRWLSPVSLRLVAKPIDSKWARIDKCSNLKANTAFEVSRISNLQSGEPLLKHMTDPHSRKPNSSNKFEHRRRTQDRSQQRY